MKTKILALSSAAVLALSTAVGVPAASASPATNFAVCPGYGSAPVRSAPNDSSSVYGYLNAGEVFSWDGTAQNGFLRGYAYGSVHANGWMNAHYVTC